MDTNVLLIDNLKISQIGIVGIGFMNHVQTNGDMLDNDRVSTTSSSDSNGLLNSNADMGSVGSNVAVGQQIGAHHTSPINYPKAKPKKKVTTFAIPIEASPLSSVSGFIRDNSPRDNAYMDESSDANVCGGAGGMHLTVGGYRTVPSDTDTTDAIESDGCAIATETGTD